jgi:hypothetical protein
MADRKLLSAVSGTMRSLLLMRPWQGTPLQPIPTSERPQAAARRSRGQAAKDGAKGARRLPQSDPLAPVRRADIDLLPRRGVDPPIKDAAPAWEHKRMLA